MLLYRLVLLILIATSVLATTVTAEEPDPFASQIRPVLAEYCLDCHASDESEGGLDLQRFDFTRGC